MSVDPYNRKKQHATVFIASAVFAVLLWGVGYSVSRVVAAVPWVLLFVVLVIGPLTQLWPSIKRRYGGNFPLHWRSELGIWFTIWSLVHVGYVFDRMGWNILDFLVGMSAPAFGAVVAVVIAIILAITSHNATFQFMGPKAWKWHQSHGTYVMFWLLTVHIYDQVFTPGGALPEDPLHLLYAATVLAVVTLHVGAFIKVVRHYREHGDYPGSI